MFGADQSILLLLLLRWTDTNMLAGLYLLPTAQKLLYLIPLQRGFCDHAGSTSFAVVPGSLLHICATNPATNVRISNQPGLEDTVKLDLPPARCLAQQLPGGKIIGEPSPTFARGWHSSNTHALHRALPCPALPSQTLWSTQPAAAAAANSCRRA